MISAPNKGDIQPRHPAAQAGASICPETREITDREVRERLCAAGFKKCVQRRQWVVLAHLLGLVQFIQYYDWVCLGLVGK